MSVHEPASTQDVEVEVDSVSSTPGLGGEPLPATDGSDLVSTPLGILVPPTITVRDVPEQAGTASASASGPAEAAGPGGGWVHPAFRLFSGALVSPCPPRAAWWYLRTQTPPAAGQVAEGPLGFEAMVRLYLAGGLPEGDKTLVCGLTMEAAQMLRRQRQGQWWKQVRCVWGVHRVRRVRGVGAWGAGRSCCWVCVWGGGAGCSCALGAGGGGGTVHCALQQQQLQPRGVHCRPVAPPPR